jgi:hypothetical protein
MNRSVGVRCRILASCVPAVTALAFVACSSSSSGSTTSGSTTNDSGADSGGATADSDVDATHADAAADAGGSDTGNDPSTEAGHDGGHGATGDGACSTNADCNGGTYCNLGDNLTENRRATCPSTGSCTPLPDAASCVQPCVGSVVYCGCSGTIYGCPHCAEVNGDTVRWEDPSGACN